ncbi:UNVERIFIED_CONTAM: hypothetical protein FKN15_057081 [Acipenser sinensis]
MSSLGSSEAVRDTESSYCQTVLSSTCCSISGTTARGADGAVCVSNRLVNKDCCAKITYHILSIWSLKPSESRAREGFAFFLLRGNGEEEEEDRDEEELLPLECRLRKACAECGEPLCSTEEQYSQKRSFYPWSAACAKHVQGVESLSVPQREIATFEQG